MEYQGLVMGIEEVLCSTAHLHRQAWRTVLAGLGIPCKNIEALNIITLSRAECLNHLLQDAGVELSLAERETVIEEMNALYRQLLVGLGPESLETGILELLDILKAQGIQLGVATASRNAVLILRRLGLGDYFDVISDGNDLLPDSKLGQIYLKAFERMNLLPAQCVVWENVVKHYAAAKDAGLHVIRGNCQQVREVLKKEVEKNAKIDYDNSIRSIV